MAIIKIADVLTQSHRGATKRLQPGLDPQGRAIGRSLTDLGFQEVGDVRVGKRITLEIDETDAGRARQRVARMCETLLANTVIEDYEIEIDEGDDA